MTVTQTVEIPASHRLTIDVPREVPVGKTRVEVILTPVVEKPTDQRSPDSESEAPRAEGSSLHPNSDALLGILSGMGDITIEQIREERLAARLAKHLKNAQ